METMGWLRWPLAIAVLGAALVACGRTALDYDEDAIGDASADVVHDRRADRAAADAPPDEPDVGADAAKKEDADPLTDAAFDGGAIYDGPRAVCASCSADLNVNEPWWSWSYQGATWLAYELPVGCDQQATWIAVHSDTSAVRVYADDGTGRPGVELVAPTKTQPMGDAGWYSIPVSLTLEGGKSYFVATSIDPYTPKTNTRTTFALSGASTRYYGSFGGGPWQGPYTGAAMLRAGNCP